MVISWSYVSRCGHFVSHCGWFGSLCGHFLNLWSHFTSLCFWSFLVCIHLEQVPLSCFMFLLSILGTFCFSNILLFPIVVLGIYLFIVLIFSTLKLFCVT